MDFSTRKENSPNDPPPEAYTMDEATPSPSFPLPYEILEMITAHLTYDLADLKACSLTCHSWYSASVPLLHHTLTLRERPFETDRIRLVLSKLHDLGLAHLVKEIRVKQRRDGNPLFVPQAFSHRHLPSFANVQTLRFQELDMIHLFIPAIGNCFKNFSLTVRSIALSNPHCTPRQLSHFLSLFPNLDNIEILNNYTYMHDPTALDTDLVSFSAPKPRGRLVLFNFSWVETWTHLIASCGDLRFRHMDLRWSASCAPILLKACAETLETLRFCTSYAQVGKYFRTPGLSASLS